MCRLFVSKGINDQKCQSIVTHTLIQDTSGLDPDLDGNHGFHRFTPALGATYQWSPAINFYGGYNESTRAPTLVELTRTSPAAPCLLPNDFVSDPALKQVLAKSWEFGLRGKLGGQDDVDSMQVNSGQYLRDDESNQVDQIGGYAVFNLHASYRFGKHFRVFAQVDNLFDRSYDNFGTLGNATNVSPGFSNPRFLSPGMPHGEWISLTYHWCVGGQRRQRRPHRHLLQILGHPTKPSGGTRRRSKS